MSSKILGPINNNNNKGKWNHLKITQAVPEQHTGKGNQGTTKIATLCNAHILWEVLM
jgi:hypothetical protein